MLPEVRARVRRYDESGDTAAVLDPGLHEQVMLLCDQVMTSRNDVPAMVTLAQWLVRRIEALTPERARRELQTARLLGALIEQLDPSALAPEIASFLAPADHVAASDSVATTLLNRFEEHGDVDALGRARMLLTDMVQSASLSEFELAGIQMSLARVTTQEFLLEGRLTDIDAAVATALDALRRTPQDSPLWPGQIAVTMWVFLVRYDRTGDLAELSEAVRLGRLAAGRTPGTHGDRPLVLLNLGCALVRRYERLGSVTDVDDGIEFIRQSLRGTREGHPARPIGLASLGFSLTRRFLRLYDPRDAEEAARVATAMVAAGPQQGPLAANLLSTAAIALAQHFVHADRPEDLDEAIRLSRKAVAAGKRFNRYGRWIQSNHAVILILRYLAYQAIEDANEAVDAAQEALAGAEPNDPARVAIVANLAHILTTRAEKTGDLSDIDTALRLGREAVAGLSPGNPARARMLNVQAHAALTRHRLTQSADDFDTAIGLMRAATNSRASPPRLRLNAARQWFNAAVSANSVPLAAEASATAVGLLPVLAWRGLDRAAQEWQLATMAGVGPQAATLAVLSGKPQVAVELLEQGRSVLWSQALQTRTDLTDLRDVAPDLAARLERARIALDDAETADPHRRRQASDWDAVVAEVRRLPGFGSFLTTTSFEQLSQVASGGPVVIVNTSRLGSHALVVTPGSVEVIDLDWLDHGAATRRAQVLLKAQRDAEESRNPVTRAHLRQTITSLLRWIWDTISAPVLSSLDTDRVHWCPTGPLTFLPLHAAGRYQKNRRSAGRTVPDQVVSSYTTNLTALMRASAKPVAAPRLLAVGMPATPGFAALPAVAAELGQIPAVSTLVGPAAIESAVLAGLDQYSWVHFACHGTQNATEPRKSAIHLHDSPLTVEKLAAHGLRNAELAYLSACHTATGSAQLADEAIHLTAALQAAGYRHVIGTLWSITDEHAATVAGSVYRLLGQHSPAAALAQAIAPLRASYPDRPELWAPYIHTGP